LGQWVTDLDSNRFAVREKAAAEIGRLGKLARPALEQALRERPSLEARRRIERLLEPLDTAKRSPQELRDARCLELLEQAGTPNCRELLKHLAGGHTDAPLTREAK